MWGAELGWRGQKRWEKEFGRLQYRQPGGGGKYAEECNLPLEIDKGETLHLRKSRKKKSADRRYVKWLGVIFDDSLDFDMHWKG